MLLLGWLLAADPRFAGVSLSRVKKLAPTAYATIADQRTDSADGGARKRRPPMSAGGARLLQAFEPHRVDMARAGRDLGNPSVLAEFSQEHTVRAFRAAAAGDFAEAARSKLHLDLPGEAPSEEQLAEAEAYFRGLERDDILDVLFKLGKKRDVKPNPKDLVKLDKHNRGRASPE